MPAGLGISRRQFLRAETQPEPVLSETPAMGHVMAITSDCFAEAGITCMTCRDVCPEAAISIRPRIGAAFLPVLDEAACTGCGACVGPCPADAIVAAPRSDHG